MHRYYKTIDKTTGPNNLATSNVLSDDINPNIISESHPEILPVARPIRFDASKFDKKSDVADLPADPALRPKITNFLLPHVCERVRRHYLVKGACQPILENFPQSDCQGVMRRFNRSWFTEFPWLEYSIADDSAFCLNCYLFKDECGDQGGGETFISKGLKDWKFKSKLGKHMGKDIHSSHNVAVRKCIDFLNQEQHIETIVKKISTKSNFSYEVCLRASIDCIRWLLKQGLAFRGHDESKNSSNKGNFLELLQFLTNHSEEVRRNTLENALGNLKIIAPRIQKDIIRACAIETTNLIVEELGEGFYSILLDESRDVSTKEQMAVVLRFINKKGCVVERILGFKHVATTTSLSLLIALKQLLTSHGLCLSKCRGQGYDGASNMRGEFNGLKSLILSEHPSTHFVHCFAHQLQLSLAAMARNHIRICELFVLISDIVTVVAGSCKR